MESGRYALHADLLGYPPPLAALAWLGATGQRSTHAVAFADPVHLQPGMDDLVVIGPQWLAAGKEELEALAVTLNAHFEKDMQFDVAGGQVFVRSPLLDEISTAPLHEVHARSARAQLPAGSDAEEGARRLHVLLNEVQMLLHDHPVNTRREELAAMPLNGIWVWGEGLLPEPPVGMQSVRFMGRGQVFAGLAAFTGNVSQPVPDCLPDDLSHDLCIEICEAAAAIDQDDIAGWESRLKAVEHDWLEPALGAIWRGELHTLDLYPGDGFRYRLRKTDLMKFWRRLLPARRPRLKFEA